MDETLGLSVGPRGVGLGEDVTDLRLSANLGEELGAAAGAVVSHEALDLDAMDPEEGESTDQEASCGLFALVGQDLGIGEARGIIDTDVEELPSRASSALTVIAVDAVTNPLDASELLDVEVDKLPGMLALITTRGLLGLEGS